MLSKRLLVAIGALGIVAAVAAVAAFALPGGDGEPEEAARPADGRYVNSRLRYQFEYPKSWSDVKDRVKPAGREELTLLDDVYVGELETVPDTFHGVRVTVSQHERAVPREALTGELVKLDEALRSRAAAARADFWDPQWVELGGLPARQYITEFPLGNGLELATAQYVTIFGDRQYTVSCQGRADKWDQAVLAGCEQVLQSFRFR
ncbi:MAG TPA: hypothetical protein VNN10_07965 [Dehalococcoidia bacterium]|nr:hypothetical protein [Dehalococcoidia bacterium]